MFCEFQSHLTVSDTSPGRPRERPESGPFDPLTYLYAIWNICK